MLEITVPKHPMHRVLKEARVSQVAAARFCDTSLSTLTQVLNGYRDPAPWLAAKLALLEDEVKARQAANAE